MHRRRHDLPRLLRARSRRKLRIFTVDIHATGAFGESLTDRVREAALKLTELIVPEMEQDD